MPNDNTRQPRHAYPILSAAEFIAQGTTPGQIVSIARRNPHQAEDIRAVAREVSRLTGQRLRYRPAHNDNRQTNRRAA